MLFQESQQLTMAALLATCRCLGESPAWRACGHISRKHSSFAEAGLERHPWSKDRWPSHLNRDGRWPNYHSFWPRQRCFDNFLWDSV